MLKHQQKKLPRQGAVKVVDGREICNFDSAKGRRIYEDRTFDMALRQNFKCAICGLIACKLQFDHEAGRGHGGGHRDDRIEVDGNWINAALCEPCNGLKGSKRYKWVNGFYKPVEKFKEVAA